MVERKENEMFVITKKSLEELSKSGGVRVKRDVGAIKKALDNHYDKVSVCPELGLSKEELERLHNSIMYTKMFKQNESYDKMNDEESIVRPLPTIR
jgi:hypothetical protein